MKKVLMMVLFAGICIMISGCACEQPRAQGPNVVVYGPVQPPEAAWYAHPNYGGTRVWYRFEHRMWDDGYSYSNDPQNHDSLVPGLGLDPRFPPAPQPYQTITTR